MKKILGLLLAVSTLAISAACASSGATGKPQSTDSGDVIVQNGKQPHGPKSAAGGQEALSASEDTEIGTLR